MTDTETSDSKSTTNPVLSEDATSQEQNLNSHAQSPSEDNQSDPASKATDAQVDESKSETDKSILEEDGIAADVEVQSTHSLKESDNESVYEEAEAEAALDEEEQKTEIKAKDDQLSSSSPNENSAVVHGSVAEEASAIVEDNTKLTVDDTADTPAETKETSTEVLSDEADPQPEELMRNLNSSIDGISLSTPTQKTTLPARNHLKLAINSNLSNVPPPPMSASSLLQSKQLEISSRFGSKDRAQQEAITTGIRSIKNTFKEIRSTLDHMPAELVGGPIDWDFWTRVVENYQDVVENEQPELLEAVAKGIPKEFRGIVWQSVARSKSVVMEELYMHLKTEESVHEKAIKRDLTRTSFYTNVEAVDKAGELFNVIKAYSNFDPDVGYTQGMVFIAVPLIMNMTESECFCLLVTLMKEYELRELFCPEMRGLHLLLHQFDRLLEQKLPLLFNHLLRQGVRSLMYASQWFLTFFSYKFPLDVVLRIFDVIITQGTEALIKLAIDLMLRNETSLLRLNFDALLDFLKLNLFNIYVSEEFVQAEALEARRFPLLTRRPSSKTTPYYKLDEFMQDSMLVEISPIDLARYKAEFEQLCAEDDGRATEIEKLKEQSGELRHEIKGYESELFTLNYQHINVVQELVDKKVILPEVLGDIDELKHEVAKMENAIQELESKLNEEKDNIPQDIETKIQDLLQQNAREAERFANLDEQFNNLTIENEQLEATIKKMPKTWFWNK
ncbi:hypothetical protein PUMCH_004278 [Australozyma saopauloensis]|uniref:GTPase-activating protein GYP5 n=1 Tax=Australozyma saopauloensis TaxID=291208 RepID=A0AAX4HGX0_9ASCO|nr:hypothetical protein PUMCH_004278 [[Candida] saopauloensis]